jgi:hypothetical protein
MKEPIRVIGKEIAVIMVALIFRKKKNTVITVRIMAIVIAS